MMQREIPEWLEKDHNAFALLRVIAKRARRTPDQVSYRREIISLETRQAIIGRTATATEIGLTQQEYRTAYQHLLKSGQISTIRTTHRYTIVSLDKDNVFDINITHSQHSEQPTANTQTTTNNKYNKENKLAGVQNVSSREDAWELYSGPYLEEKRISDPYVIQEARTAFLNKAKAITKNTVHRFIDTQLSITPPHDYADDIFKNMPLPKEQI